MFVGQMIPKSHKYRRGITPTLTLPRPGLSGFLVNRKFWLKRGFSVGMILLRRGT